MSTKIFASALVTLLFVGIGCATPPSKTSSTNTQSEQSAVVTNMPATNQIVASSKKLSDLTALPAIAVFPTGEDSNTWSSFTTKSAITIIYLSKGRYAPKWTYDILAKNDPRLQGGCVVTDDTVYKKTSFASWGVSANVCQTTSSFGAGSATRVDYFVFPYTNGRVHLLTITKIYPAGFDMDGYGAVVDHMVGSID